MNLDESTTPAVQSALDHPQKDAAESSINASVKMEPPTSEPARPKRLFVDSGDPGPSKRARVESAFPWTQMNRSPRPSIEQIPHPTYRYQHQHQPPGDFHNGYLPRPHGPRANWAQGGSEAAPQSNPYQHPGDFKGDSPPRSYGPRANWAGSEWQTSPYPYPPAREFPNGYVLRPCGRPARWARGGGGAHGVGSRDMFETPRARKSFQELSVPRYPRSHQTTAGVSDRSYSVREARGRQTPVPGSLARESMHAGFLEELFKNLSEDVERYIEEHDKPSTPSGLLDELEMEFGWSHPGGEEGFPRVYHLIDELRGELGVIAGRRHVETLLE